MENTAGIYDIHTGGTGQSYRIIQQFTPWCVNVHHSLLSMLVVSAPPLILNKQLYLDSTF